jgi:hypothetical protein
LIFLSLIVSVSCGECFSGFGRDIVDMAGKWQGNRLDRTGEWLYPRREDKEFESAAWLFELAAFFYIGPVLTSSMKRREAA